MYITQQASEIIAFFMSCTVARRKNYQYSNGTNKSVLNSALSGKNYLNTWGGWRILDHFRANWQMIDNIRGQA